MTDTYSEMKVGLVLEAQAGATLGLYLGYWVMVLEVRPGSTADLAGIERGDLIDAVGGEPVPNMRSVADTEAHVSDMAKREGKVALTVHRLTAIGSDGRMKFSAEEIVLPVNRPTGPGS